MKTVGILGATGSVGQSVAVVIAAHPDKFRVAYVTANENAEKLADVAERLNADKAVLAAIDGNDAIIETASMPVDLTVCAIAGTAGLLPVLKAVEQGRAVAIANKEPLVAAGPLVIRAARKAGTTILPLDSEHNAVFQILERGGKEGLEKVILTASGGPFRTWSREQMEKATPEQAVAHPNWSMGSKISVDSATMMNKALEVIEAHYLFDLPPEKIEVLVHPQSLVHAMVEYADGSVLTQMGAPDMRTPAAHVLGWPERVSTPGQRLDLTQAQEMTFEPVDHERFPALQLAYDCLKAGPWACITLNAANEVAVEAFLSGRIGFLEVVRTVQKALDCAEVVSVESLEDVLALDLEMRRFLD